MIELSFNEQQRNDSPNNSGCLHLIRSDSLRIASRTQRAAIITAERDGFIEQLSELFH